jgi:hypothetical protein
MIFRYFYQQMKYKNYLLNNLINNFIIDSKDKSFKFFLYNRLFNYIVNF